MKHNLNKTKQDLLGQYMTVNADKILADYNNLVLGKIVIDPCAGHGDLLSWAWRNGALDCEGYDIEPQGKDKYNDMYKNPVDCTGKLVVTNPPYLSSNRAEDKEPYKKWKQNDLYKCYLATLMESNVEEAIIIQPSNFLCESNAKARKMLFANYRIQSAQHWQEEIFEGVSIGIMVMHIKREQLFEFQGFWYKNMTTDKITWMDLAPDTYLHGPNKLTQKWKYHRFEKVNKGMNAPNSNIIISLLDKGTYGLGFAYNEGEPIYCNPSSFTTYQINLPNKLDEEQQRMLVDKANKKLNDWRKEYDSMFLSNYISYSQKIMSKTIANKILWISLVELLRATET